MQSSAVVLSLSGVLQNFPDHVSKEILLLAVRHSCFFKSMRWYFWTEYHRPRKFPLFSLPYCINTKDPNMSKFFYLRVTCPDLLSSVRVLFSELHTMHIQWLSLLSFPSHIHSLSHSFSCSSFRRSKGK